MNFKIPVTGLLIGLLVACSATKPDSTAQSAPKQQQAPQSQADRSNTITTSAASIGQAAKLTPEQINSLISAENSRIPPADKSNIELQKSRTILPTYVPPGFKVEEFKINPCDQFGKSNRYTYRITYQNASKTSFNIDNYFVCSQGGADPGDVKTIEINSKKFDKVIINYTEFDQSRNSPYINGEITSPSPDTPGAFRMLLFFEYYSNSLNLAEATKIMESMEYLNKSN